MAIPVLFQAARQTGFKGWKEAQTVLRRYQQADAVQLRKALDSRPRVRASPKTNRRESISGNPPAESRKLNAHNDM